MDRDERHELKDNELREFFTNFGDWWQRYGNSVLIVVIVVVVVVLGYQFYTSYHQRQYNSAWQDLASSSSPDALMAVAESYDRPAVQSLARLRAADLLVQQAMQPGAAGDRSDQDALEQAELLYQAVVDSERADPAYRVNALMGLASVAENREAWQGARNQWNAAIELAQRHRLTHLKQQATARRDRLDVLRQPVHFAEGQPRQFGPAPGQSPGGMSPPGLGRPGGANPPTGPATQPSGGAPGGLPTGSLNLGSPDAAPATQPAPSP